MQKNTCFGGKQASKNLKGRESYIKQLGNNKCISNANIGFDFMGDFTGRLVCTLEPHFLNLRRR